MVCPPPLKPLMQLLLLLVVIFIQIPTLVSW
jgi:hypothetical protein